MFKITLEKIITLLIIGILPIISFAQEATKYFDKYHVELHLTDEEIALKLPSNFKPLFNYPIRDVSICTGPDSTYYMTGTTGDPDWWSVTSEIKIWKSKDLKHWVPIISGERERATVWNVDREGVAWQQKIVERKGVKFRPLWAPEIHYFKGTFWLTYCFPQLGNGILKSTSGKAEGPYVSAFEPNVPINNQIDASLFLDDDGKVYSVSGGGVITPLKDDLSGVAGASTTVKPSNFSRIGFEGAFLFKTKGKYYMSAADFVNGKYTCFVASADHLYGPYGDRYIAIPHGGHNVFFQDFEGNWWSTFFGNEKGAPFKERPGILRVEFDEHGHIRPLVN
ncbi:family 43 glycosylhydrolase [Pedobacter sp. SD-b]|uniref:Family 43 glycosylhydrolase n=1 Tax=Pedobacter segetis TaxID=2793069 RepID=A0ABS1BL14_9SPHI|nr:family 43 glycosylhydrolase [Pedobacter segetis]MBK0383583.1 family 43 glycosylhydrolase [Pedobacter segetis]